MSRQRIRLCLRDLYHLDVVEMIERETRKYELWSIEHPDDPDFHLAFQFLWDAFGGHGEMEREEVIRGFLRDDPFTPDANGTYYRYFLLVARGPEGDIRGVRDGTVLVNPSYDADLCLVYLSHIYILPEARGTVLSYWLRIAPVELAVRYLADLGARGCVQLPLPDAPGRHFGMRLNLCAEMEYFAPELRASWQRLLFYGRGGFDAIDPRYFPYLQPDFRPPEEIRQTGNRPVPFAILLRRMGRERQALLPIEEAQAVMRLLYDEFRCHCEPELLQSSLDLVVRRLEQRAAAGKDAVRLLPLPTGPRDLHRLKRLYRPFVYSRYYPDVPDVREYLQSGVRERIARNPRLLDEELARIAAELENRPHWVYGNRDREFAWDGEPIPPEPDALPGDNDTIDFELTDRFGST